MLVALGGLFWLDWWLECCLLADPHGWPLAIVLAALIVLGMHELSHLAAASGVRMLGVSATAGALLVGLIPFWWQLVDRAYHGPRMGRPLSGFGVLLVLSWLLIAIFIEQMIGHRARDAFRQSAVTLLAAMYLGLGGAMILAVRMAYGVPALVLLVAAAKFTDIGAYFAGALWGKHKLIPWLSPAKSWEGLAGGIVAAVGISLLVGYLLNLPLGAAYLAVFGVLMAATGQIGDLCESLLKRAGNVKDSGTLIPEFGGVLDMLDSVLLAAPFAYVALTLMVVHQ